MFKEERDAQLFDWSMLGNIEEGRPNLGNQTHVGVYRLMQFTLRDVLVREFGPDKTDEIFYSAGKKAGEEFCRNILDKNLDFNGFVKQAKKSLEDLKVGMLLVEKADMENMRFTLTVAEDLDCSGLPPSDETICVYDEGFLSGLLGEYAGGEFNVKEVDCWCSGDRVCRFEVEQVAGG